MRQVFGEWGVVTETKSTSYGILSAPVANNIRGYLILCQSLPERSFLQDAHCDLWKRFLTGSRECFRHTFYHNWRYPFLRIKQADIRIRKSFPGFIKKG